MLESGFSRDWLGLGQVGGEMLDVSLEGGDLSVDALES